MAKEKDKDKKIIKLNLLKDADLIYKMKLINSRKLGIKNLVSHLVDESSRLEEEKMEWFDKIQNRYKVELKENKFMRYNYQTKEITIYEKV